MDKFEQTMQNMMKMSPQEGMKTLQAVIGKCICGECPTHTNAARASGESFFCGTGKSFRHITTEVNCLCGRCPVKSELGLKYGFFCMRGSEKTLRYDQSSSAKKT
ncbi:MAG: DUF2769 domain-containing protein [Methanomicrobiales archaeon]|nr:DUF2769 domain-containing protein [Methanomicrobiales archaeon]